MVVDYARRPPRNAYLTILFVWRWGHNRSWASPEAFARRVREDIAHGADVIKVAVSGNPLDDIATLEQIVFVMHDGRIIRREAVLGR